MKRLLVCSFALVFLSYFSLPCRAAYISDSCEVPCRSGPALKYRIITMLSSGQEIQVVQKGNEWSLVQLPNGKQGWVSSNYLVNRPPWEVQAKNLEKENQALREKQANFDKEWHGISQREKDLTAQLQTTTQANEKLRADYEELKKGATEYLNLKEQYDAVKTALASAMERADNLEQENKELRSSQDIKWFATGSAVLLGGWVTGLIMGRSRRKQKASLYS